MNELTFNKILLLFDYFKEAYRVNKNNKVLYKPQIIYIIIKAIFIALFALSIYNLLGLLESYETYYRLNFLDFITKSGFLAALLTLLIVVFFGQLIIEPGLYAMYVKSVYKGTTNIDDFKIGVKKYFWKFLGIDLLVFGFWIVVAVPFLCISIFTLFIAASLIVIAVDVLLATWKIAIIVNDETVFEALKTSIEFGKKNFIPVGLLVIIKNSFLYLRNNGGSTGNNFQNTVNLSENASTSIDYANKIFDIINIVFAVLIPVVTIAITFSAIITMIFEVFFALVFVIAYKEQFLLDEIDVVEEYMESEGINHE